MTKSKRVLIVDDDQDIVNGAAIRLGAAGYETMVAKDGIDGLSKAIDTLPDAILLDVRMPRMDGLSTLTRLQDHDQTKDIPIVMLSASIVDQHAALDAGAKFFVSKPYNGKQLVAILDAAMTTPTNERSSPPT